jgi:hypothetical protein
VYVRLIVREIRFRQRIVIVRWLSTSLLILLTISIGIPAVAAQESSPSFGMTHQETGLTHIELTLEAGEAEEFTLRHSVRDDSPVDVTVFPSNVYTVRGGGMGVNDIDNPRTGATTWLDLRTTDLTLEPEEPIEQLITIDVPSDAAPGEYVTAIVSQEDSDGDSAERARQVVPIYITVPGNREPAMDLDGIQHRVSEGQSVIDIILENTGNVHLQPQGHFALRSIGGDTLAETGIGLDTVYAGTSTRVEITFTTELPAGEYLIDLSLRDDITGASIESDGLSVIIAGAEPTPETTSASAVADDTQSDDGSDGGVIGGVRIPGLTDGATVGTNGLILGGLALVSMMVLLAALIVRKGRRPAGSERRPVPVAQPQSQLLRPEPEPRPHHRPRPIRQLVPPGRAH